MNQSGDNRLAYILSSGNEDGALNTLLIQYLTPHVIQSHPLLSIRNAINSGDFTRDIGVFTKSAVNFAKNNPRFIHLGNEEGFKLFYQTMYDWLDSFPMTKFKGLIESAIKDYEVGLSSLKFWGNGSRRKEVEAFCKSSIQSKAVALTFINGDSTSTLNSVLFKKIITAIKDDVSKSEEKKQMPGYKLFMQYNESENYALCFNELKKHAKVASHRQEAKIASATL